MYCHAYEVCSSNWIPREEEDRIVQQRLKLLSFLVMRKQVNFGELVVFQICRINSDLTEDSDVNFPNFIHQIMECQKDISHMFDDDQVMGEPQCIDQDKIGELVFI